MNLRPSRAGGYRRLGPFGASLAAAVAAGALVLSPVAAQAASPTAAESSAHAHTTTDFASPKAADIGSSLDHGFVAHSGSSLTLDDHSFRFSGTNIYWLGLDENVPPGTVDYPTDFRIRDAIDTAANMGATVIRSHMMVSTGNPKSILPSTAAGYNEQAFATIDYAIAYAASKGIRLVLPLTDNWAYYSGGLRDFARTYGLCEDSTAACPQFYSDPRVIADFQNYVSTILNHVNPYTGLALKNDPAIMAWELGNELNGMTPQWIDTISTQLKMQAPHQLVSAGKQFGIDPNTLAAKNVDIVDVHYYPPTAAAVTADAQTITAAGKAYLGGEYDSNSASTVLPALSSDSEISGMLSWSLFGHDDTSGFVQHSDGFQIHYPGDNSAMAVNVTAQQNYARAIGTTVAPVITRAPLITSVANDYGLHELSWRGATGANNYLVQRRDDSGWATLTTSPVGDAPWLDTTTHGAATYRVVPLDAQGHRGPASASVTVAASGQVTVDAVNSLTPLLAHAGVTTYPLGEDSVVTGTSSAGGSATWSTTGLRSATLSVVSRTQPQLAFAAGTPGGDWIALTTKSVKTGAADWTVTATTPPGSDRLRVSWPSGSAATSTGLTRVLLRSIPDVPVLDDQMNDLSLTSAHTGVLGIDSGNASLFGGDTGRADRGADGAASATWAVSTADAPEGISGFDATAYYWPDQPGDPLTFAVSSDGATWTDITPTVAATPGAVGGSWTKNVYSVRGLSGIRQVRVTWPNDSAPSWAQQLGELKFFGNGNATLTAPGAVTTTSPADSASDVRGIPTLSWQPAARAAVYRVVLATSADLSNPVAETQTGSTSFLPSVTLAEGTTYYWQVTALNGAGTTASDVASFSAATRPTTPLVAEDFDSYASDAALSTAYVRNTGGGTITPTLVASGAGTGHGNAMQLSYDLGSAGYAGVTRTFATAQDWWGYDDLSLWLDRSQLSAGQTVSVQIVAGGSYYEAALGETGPVAAGVASIPFGDFTPPSWASGEGPLDLTSVTQLSFYLGGTGTGALGVDDVTAMRAAQ